MVGQQLSRVVREDIMQFPGCYRQLFVGSVAILIVTGAISCSDDDEEEKGDEPVQWEYPDPYADTDDVDWVVETDAIYARLPAVDAQGGIVFGDWNGVLRRVEPDDGEVSWSFEAQGRIDTAPAIDETGSIYVGDWEGRVYALSTNGDKEWSYDAGAIVDASPTIDGDGRVWIADNGGGLHILTPDGDVDEHHELGAAATTAVSVLEDEQGRTAFVGTADNRIHCVSDSGTVDDASIDGHARFDLAITDEGYAVATMDNGVVAAVDQHCDVVWQENTTYATIMPAVVTEGGDLWAWGHNRTLFLYDGQSGDRLEQFDHLIRANATTAGIVSDEGRILLGTQGIVDFSEDGDSGIRSSIDVMDAPVLSDGAAFATTERGALVRLAGTWPKLGESSWPTQHANLQRTGRVER